MCDLGLRINHTAHMQGGHGLIWGEWQRMHGSSFRIGATSASLRCETDTNPYTAAPQASAVVAPWRLVSTGVGTWLLIRRPVQRCKSVTVWPSFLPLFYGHGQVSCKISRACLSRCQRSPGLLVARIWFVLCVFMHHCHIGNLIFKTTYRFSGDPKIIMK